MPKKKKGPRARRAWHRARVAALTKRIARNTRRKAWDQRRKNQKALRHHQRQIEKLDAQIARAKANRRPNVITAAQLGLTFQYVWGGKGAVYRGAGHYDAGSRAPDEPDLAATMRSHHAYHRSLGWGGISYEALIADDGTIGFGNPTDRMSAAVAVNNTGMVNICCPGTTGDRLTAAQEASIRWLKANWHTRKVPSAHRLPRPLSELDCRGHREWPSQSTACPGSMLDQYKELLA